MTFVDVHGYLSGPHHLWHPELHRLILESGHTVLSPQLPGKKYPDHQDWLPLIDEAFTQSNEPITIVGHSLGTRAVLLYLEHYQVSVQNIVLIGPFNNDISNASYRDGAYANFFENLIDLALVKSRTNKSIIIGSLDDSRIPFVQAEQITKDLDGVLYSVPESDHFLHTKWSHSLWDIIQKETLG